ncbi:MAG: hypothetical protein ACRDYA_05640 [Egibacteraceae bacterium]
MKATVFESRPLPLPLAGIVLERLERAHREEPFSAVNPRGTVHRVARIVGGLGVPVTVYRGGLDLRGAEIDHLWLAATLESSGGSSGFASLFRGTPLVLDVAFPLFAEHFIEVLRRFVAGDATPADLDEVASSAGVRQRVVGLFPEPVRYLGTPVWSART